MQHAVHCLM